MPIEAFLLGLSSGTYCAASCAPVALPFFFSRGREARPFLGNARLLGLFLVGRFLAYVAVGLALGFIGAYAARFVDPGFSLILGRIAYAASGALMIAAGLVEGFPRLRICAVMGRGWRPGIGAFAFGALTGASICPPFFAAASRVFACSVRGGGFGAALPGSLSGAAYFAFFFLGTSVWLLPLLGVPFLTGRKALLGFIARSTMTMLGAYFLLVVGLFGST
jgi:sulfite exporter TauE/SafE